MLVTDLDPLVTELMPVDEDAAERLRTLDAAISSGSLRELAHLHLPAVLDPAAIEERAVVYFQNRSPWLDRLELIRNVLVLVPIALTWFGLSRAASAYNQLVERSPELVTQPFLLLWEQSFQGLSGSLDPTFSTLAMIDAALLVGLVAITWVVHRQRDVKEADAERRAATLRHRVEQVLWRLNQQFALSRAQEDNAQIAASIGTAISQFETSTGELLDLLRWERQHLEDFARGNFNNLKLFTDSMTEGANNLIVYGRDVAQVYDGIKTSVDHMSSNVERVHLQQDRLLQSLDSVGGHSNVLMETTRAMGQRFDLIASELQRVVLRNGDASQAVTAAANEMGQLAMGIIEGETTLRQAFADSNGDLQAVARQLSDSSAATREAVGLLNDVSQKLDTSVRANGTLTGQIVTAVTSMAETAEQIGQANHDLAGEVATIVRSVNNEVQSLTQSNERVLTMLRETSEQHNNITQAATNAITNVEAVSGQLLRAVNTLAEETRRLNPHASRGFSPGWAAVGLGCIAVALLGSIAVWGFQLQQVILK